jgi:hypothetical protein
MYGPYKISEVPAKRTCRSSSICPSENSRIVQNKEEISYISSNILAILIV